MSSCERWRQAMTRKTENNAKPSESGPNDKIVYKQPKIPTLSSECSLPSSRINKLPNCAELFRAPAVAELTLRFLLGFSIYNQLRDDFVGVYF